MCSAVMGVYVLSGSDVAHVLHNQDSTCATQSRQHMCYTIKTAHVLHNQDSTCAKKSWKYMYQVLIVIATCKMSLRHRSA